MHKSIKYIAPVFIGLSLFACKEDENPYNEVPTNPTEVVNDVPESDASTFVALHSKIFKPTCANSGCHDGTNVNDPAFPPIDFTTLESTYSSIIKGPVRKNNEDSSYTYLVDPGNPAGSAVLGRMLDNPQNPGLIMPLEVDDDSDWEQKKATYIENIRTWIANGAPNAIGQPYSEGNMRPTFKGLVASSTSLNRLTRAGAQTEIRIPLNDTEVTFYFAFTDQETNPENFTFNKVKISDRSDDFSNALEFDLQVLATPFTEDGRTPGVPVTYTHSFTVSNVTTQFPANQVHFIRAYVQDENADPTEIPNNGNSEQIIQYFSFTRFNG